MAVKYLKSGEPFQFPESFGFSGSAVAPRSHPRMDTDPYGDGLGGGPSKTIRKAGGGQVMPPQSPAGDSSMGALSALAQPGPNGQEATISMPVSTAVKAVKNLVQTGAMHGAQAAGQAVARHFAGRQQMPPQAAAAPPPTPMPAPPAMAKGGKFLQSAIKNPGRETKRAKAAGRSVHGQMEHDAHSTNPSLRGAANLGLRLTGGDLSPHRKKGK